MTARMATTAWRFALARSGVIDGGRGQLTAAQETLAALGLTDVPLVAVAKGPDRDAGRETFFVPGREPFKLQAARSGALFRAAAARRGASLRHRLAPRAPQDGHPRGRLAGNPRHRPDAQARAAASFRHAEGDRARVARRSGQSARASAPRRRARSTISSTSAPDDRGRQDTMKRQDRHEVAKAGSRHIYVWNGCCMSRSCPRARHERLRSMGTARATRLTRTREGYSFNP